MRQPNILLLYTDQQRWDALGVNGNPDIQTPHLDRLAAEGTNFQRYCVQNPVCMPSRISFLSGQYPSTLGITHMGVPVPEETPTLPRMLGAHGYTCANIGKLHFLPHANRDHRKIHPDYGFHHREISDEPGCYEDAYRAWVRRKAPGELDKISCGLPPAAANWHASLEIEDGIVHPAEREPLKGRAFAGRSDLTHSAFVGERTIDFLERRGGQPFFCVAGFYSPHAPFVAPREFLDRYDPADLRLPTYPEGHPSPPEAELRSVTQGYYAMVSEVDHYVGNILDCLERRGLADNTIVIFTSDHGEFLGDHNRYAKGYPAPDCVSRVPFLIRGPEDLVPSGRTEHRIVEAVDFVPTILEAAGIPVPPSVQGRSLFSREREGETGRALMEHDGWRSLRTDGYRYLIREDGEELLFDLKKDPGEYRNVASESGYAEVLAEHRKRLLQRLLEIHRPLERIWPY